MSARSMLARLRRTCGTAPRATIDDYLKLFHLRENAATPEQLAEVEALEADIRRRGTDPALIDALENSARRRRAAPLEPRSAPAGHLPAHDA